MTVSESVTPAEAAEILREAPNFTILSHAELEDARNIGRNRGGVKVGMGSNVDADQDPEEVNELGAIGELAFAKIMDGNVDRSVSKTGDDGYDLEINGVVKVDVKTTEYVEDGRLLVKTENLDDPDMETDSFSLMANHGDGVIELVGAITAKTLDKHRKKDQDLSGLPYDENPAEWPRGKENVIVEQEDLRVPAGAK